MKVELKRWLAIPFLLVLALASAKSGAKVYGDSYDEGVAAVLTESELEIANNKFFEGAVGLSFDWLTQLIEDNNVNTVERLIPLLPENLRANYTLMKRSQSLQEASPLNPRALLFAHDGSLALTFNGHPSQVGYQKVEVMEYDTSKNQFRFFEIDFGKANRKKYSPPNPKACMQCHSSYPKPYGAPKPIWSNYDHWIDAYGEKADSLEEPLIAISPKKSQKESALFNEYLENAATHPRYKHLIRRTQYSNFSPYMESEGSKFQDRGLTLRQRNLINMPNMRLAKVMDALNAKRVAFEIIENSTDQQRNKILHQYFCSTFKEYAYVDFFPVDLGAFDLSLNDLSLEFNEQQKTYHSGSPDFSPQGFVIHEVYKKQLQKYPQLKAFFSPQNYLSYYQFFSIMRNNQISIGSMKEGQRPDLLYFNTAWSLIMQNIGSFLSKPNFKYTKKSDEKYRRLCEQLQSLISPNRRHLPRQKISDPFLNSNRTQIELQQTRSLSGMLKQCAECHQSESRMQQLGLAPWIPFSDKQKMQKFADELRRDNLWNLFLFNMEHRTLPVASKQTYQSTFRDALHSRRMMPLGRKPLSKIEQRRLMEYLMSF